MYVVFSETSMDDVQPIMLVGLGALAGLVLILGVLTLTVRLRRRRADAGHKPVSEKVVSAQTSLSLPPAVSDDDRNPDVVPHTTGEKHYIHFEKVSRFFSQYLRNTSFNYNTLCDR